MDLLIRTGIALLLLSAGIGLSLLYKRWVRSRSSKLLRRLGPLRSGTFILVYFTSPTCVPCKTVQRPAIEQLMQKFGDALQVLEIDALQHPDLASSWGVLSVPTTFVINQFGKICHVNYGIARAEKLMEQIQDAHGWIAVDEVGSLS